jgi:uncharacterized protein YdeI (YjbR/CyaY-like superfamily)
MPIFFESPASFCAWLEAHSASHSELIVGFHKRGTGRPSMTWQESVDEALCHGWIDGVRTRIDEQSYKIRFTPRKPTSTWSAINIERVGVLQREGRMTAAGLAAFGLRREAKSRTYAYEQAETAMLEAKELALFRRSKAAWKFFEAQPPGHQHRCLWHIVSAKRAETRASRLARLIEASRNGLRL